MPCWQSKHASKHAVWGELCIYYLSVEGMWKWHTKVSSLVLRRSCFLILISGSVLLPAQRPLVAAAVLVWDLWAGSCCQRTLLEYFLPFSPSPAPEAGFFLWFSPAGIPQPILFVICFLASCPGSCHAVCLLPSIFCHFTCCCLKCCSVLSLMVVLAEDMVQQLYESLPL